MRYDAIVIGGGAAGLFCAIEAGKRGRKVAVLEHNAEVGRKIVISGGGRCNFTNIDCSSENFISENPHFSKSALSRFTPRQFIDLVKKHKIDFYEKKLGQLFCRESSREIVEMLLRECRDTKVEILTGCSVANVAKSSGFVVETSRGTFRSNDLIVACGGLSFPKIGASDLGFRIARQFGIKIIDARPSLVALVLKDADHKQLAGVSVDAVVSSGKHSFRENILFTHRGLSGPAILQISNYWQKDVPVNIDLLPSADAAELLCRGENSRKDLGNYLGGFLPQRLAQSLVKGMGANGRVSTLSKKQIGQLSANIKNWEVNFRDTEGYDRAEVTLGGVSTDELSSQTMGSRKVAGLYFIGEVVDVTGWLGGYNFQWAWASAYAAGNAV
jgi:predicted Rossmann fold flavoprotein